MNKGAEITATNFEYGNIQINNGDVKYGARIDTRDVKTTSRSSNFGMSIGISSPIKDRIEQAAGAVKQARRGDTIGGLVAGVNAGTGMVSGLAGNQGTRQAYHTGNLSQSEVRNASANNNFYANIGVNAGYSTSKNSNNSHNESAVVTTMKPMNENSSITYNNVNNITYQGTQAQGGTFIYNNVKNIRKEAVELHNSSSSRSSNFGISTGATIGYGYGTQITGNGGSVSANRSNLNTTETIYQNGNFQNVNEVHNNTGTMTLSGFNQEGGKVTGNIGKLVVESRQNTSTTTGRSSGVSVGISANGVPSSLNVNGSRTNGSRAFVDNQSSFIVGEGSNLHVGTVENTGAIIGKQSENGTTFKVDKYVGHDIQNYDTMTTTGVSLGTSLGKSPRVTNIGFNQDDRGKQGITRNTVVGNVEIGEASGSPINRDITKANEVTKDAQHSTNINVESQTIEYATNPGKLKEDIGKAKEEIRDVVNVVRNTINNQGVDKRGFMEELSTQRRATTINNLIGTNLNQLQKDFKNGKINEEEFKNELEVLVESVGKDMGIEIDLVYTDNKNIPEDSKNVEGVARLENGKLVAYINMDKITSTSQLIGTVFEEVTHLMDAVAGKQKETTEEEKLQGEYGLESLGKPVNDYFREQYKEKEGDREFIGTGDGVDYSENDGENIGNNRPGYGLILKAKANVTTKIYKLGDPKFLDDLSLFSAAYGLASPYFGFYYLPKEMQEKYFGEVKDNNGTIAKGLIVNRFDPKGYEKLKNSKEYTIAMHKANLVSFESAYEHFEKNGLKPGTFYVDNNRFSQNFASQDEIMKIKTRTGLGQIFTDARGLNITFRGATIAGHIKIVVSKPNNKGEQFVMITRYTRIADNFSKPYDLLDGFPFPFEAGGNAYGLMSDYEKHNLFPEELRYLVKGKSPTKIKNEIKNSMNISKNNEINNINKIDPWEYNHFLEDMKKRAAKKRGKK